MRRFKIVQYRGGVAVFKIPEHWREEYQPAGGGTFYEDSPGSGTLRLNVITVSSDDTPAEQMATTVFSDGPTSTTSSGMPLYREEKTVEENGEQLHMVTWQVAIPVPPQSIRLAIFTYTILTSHLQDSAFAAVIEDIETSIKQGNYSQDAGDAGDFEHARGPLSFVKQLRRLLHI